MRAIYFCFLFLLMLSYPTGATMQCNESMLMPEGASYTWYNYTFEYTDLLESGVYPGYFLDPKYTVTPPGLSYRSNYSSGPAWSKITQPAFTIETLYLFGDAGNSTHNIFCVDTNFLPTPTPTPSPTPTIPITGTPTPTGTGTPSYNGTNGSNSSYPPYYQEGSYLNLQNNTLPEDSHGFNELAEGMGYQATVGGYISMAKDYMFFYILVGFALFIGKLWGG